MAMAAEQRKLLEQLMGATLMTAPSSASGGGGAGGHGRSASNGDSQRPLTVDSPRVCRAFLLGYCPHDLLVGTKHELGACPRVHNEGLKLIYAQDEEDGRRHGFEYEVEPQLQRLVDDLDRRVEGAAKRLERTPEEEARAAALLHEMTTLEEGIRVTVSEAQLLGRLGLVSRALDTVYSSDKLRVDRELRARDLHALDTGADDFQKLQVCDVCGAYLSKLDNDRRLADHFGGKAHLGYARLRRAHASVQELVKKAKADGVSPPAPARDEYSRGGGGYRRDGSRDRYDRSNDRQRYDNPRGGGGRRYDDRGPSNDRWHSDRRSYDSNNSGRRNNRPY